MNINLRYNGSGNFLLLEQKIRKKPQTAVHFSPTFRLSGNSATLGPTNEIWANRSHYRAVANGVCHGFTGSGHPVACAVTLENLAIIEEQDLTGNAARLEPMFQDGLRKFADHPLVGEVRDTGLIAGIEMAKDRTTKASFEPAGKMAPRWWSSAPKRA